MTDSSGPAGANAPRTNAAAEATALDRRRAKLQHTQAAATAAASTVARLDAQLDVEATHRAGFQTDLDATLDRGALLKKAIKASTKHHDQLATARERARAAVAKAHQRAAEAEAKYDRAVLAEMLRKEKDNDLAAHPTGQARAHRGEDTARSTAAGGTAAGARTTHARTSSPDESASMGRTAPATTAPRPTAPQPHA